MVRYRRRGWTYGVIQLDQLGSEVEKASANTLNVDNTSLLSLNPDLGTLRVDGASGAINSTSGITINGSGAKYLHTATTGSTRTIELQANVPGDWAMHCHMTHHIMNQMGHGLPNMVGVDTSKLDERVRRVLPQYMSMGQNGMGDDMEMPIPKNSVAMRNAHGKYTTVVERYS